MKFFLDTEFIEGTQKKTFLGFTIGETKPTIDLISIGIVGEDGSEYYAVSKEFNLNEAWNRYDFYDNDGLSTSKVYWLRENVLYKIFAEMYRQEYPAEWNFVYGNLGNFMGNMERNNCGLEFFKRLLETYGKTRKQIAKEVHDFCGKRNYNNDEYFTITNNKGMSFTNDAPEFYAYYCNYDWVVFCWLFGKMIDLPKGWPMYCNDIKQILDNKVKFYMPLQEKFFSEKPKSFSDALKRFKDHPDYPEQEDSKKHHALEDARYDRDLYNFLNSL